MESEKSSILIIYTGGTIGMKTDAETGALVPFDFSAIYEEFPSLKRLKVDIEVKTLSPVIDSSNVSPANWLELAAIIRDNYARYDGFVVLHGTDTMAYTASALSFMLENLDKPVILTGSQLPIGVLRSDGKDNLINALEMAAAVDENGEAKVREVAVVFGSRLFRGNRITKFSAESFSAFMSANFPPLAQSGVHIKWFKPETAGQTRSGRPLVVHTELEVHVLIVKVHPGMSPEALGLILNTPGLKGVVLATYGSGNAPTSPAFAQALADAVRRGIAVLNVTQCTEGAVEMGKYAASNPLKAAGVVSGYDMTTEAAVTKMMYVLGLGRPFEESRRLLSTPLRGEMTV